jgi:PASTA domain
MSANTQPAHAARARVTVEDYDHQSAADAAIALRRAGLRPALERTFHWGEDTHGLVVAQEPAAGNEVPLDSTVLLFVSAPGERAEADSAGKAVAPDEIPADVVAGEVTGEPRRADRSSATSRRRKPRPSPVLSAQAGAIDGTSVGVEEEWTTAEADDWPSSWADQDPLVALAERRLADAPAGVRLLEHPTPRSPLVTVGVAALTFLVTLLAVLLLGHAHALQAAGAFNGTPISGVQTFVDKLRGNLVWLGGTAMGLVIAVVGIMFMAGHSRAHDLAIRTIVGLAILASISGIVA